MAGAGSGTAGRIGVLDALRGLAILGILIMNVQAFAMVGAAYINPTALGQPRGAEYVAWLLTHLLADRKFVSILAFVFGLSIALMHSRSRLSEHGFQSLMTRRMIWLMVIGLLHAHLLFHGDILFAYALCGLVAVRLRHLPPRQLLIVGLALFAFPTVINLGLLVWVNLIPFEQLIELVRSHWWPSRSLVWAEEMSYHGDLIQQIAHRITRATPFQLWSLLTERFWRVLGFMLLGIAAVRLGALERDWSPAELRFGFVIAGVGLVLGGLGVWISEASGWTMGIALFVGRLVNYWASALVALGWVALALLLWRTDTATFLVRRLEEVGRLALSNYLFQSLACSFVFYGHGLSLFGQLSRVEQLGVVLGVWIVQITLTRLWLVWFSTGPVEWGWRELAKRPLVARRASV